MVGVVGMGFRDGIGVGFGDGIGAAIASSSPRVIIVSIGVFEGVESGAHRFKEGVESSAHTIKEDAESGAHRLKEGFKSATETVKNGLGFGTKKLEDAMEPLGFIPHASQDMHLTDISTANLRTALALYLGVLYLGENRDPPIFPVSGKLWGMVNARPFVNLVVQTGESTPVNVFFLVNTASPYTYISEAALAKIAPGKTIESFSGLIHGHKCDIHPSPPASHFAETNVLGANCMSAWTLTISYPDRTVTLMNSADQK